MGKDIASWTLADETALIAYLREHKAAAGDGGSFKATTFEGAAAVVEEKRTKGGPKTGNACQNKWIALRRTFRAIQAIQNQSGWTWSDEKGADISPDMEPAWEKFVLAHKDAKPFKNRGWTHFTAMAEIMPRGGSAPGVYIFRPTQGVSGLDSAPARPPSPIRAPSVPISDWELSDVDREVAEHEDEPSKTKKTSATPAPAPSRLRKRERALSHSPIRSAKRKPTGAADAIQGLTDSISTFGDNICKVLAIDPMFNTLHRRREAIRLAQQESCLLMPQRLLLCNILERDDKVIDAYLGLDRSNMEFCQMWLSERVAAQPHQLPQSQ